MEEKKRKAEEMQGTARTVLQSFGKAFSGEFLSINTGHTLGHTKRTTNSCVLGQTQRWDLKQVTKLEVFGTRL